MLSSGFSRKDGYELPWVANYSKVRVIREPLFLPCLLGPSGMIDVALEICPYQFGIFYDLKCFLSSGSSV